MCSYLKSRRQRIQINNKFSSLKKVIAVVSRGSVDRPLLFNLFINDLFLFICFSTLSNYTVCKNLFTTGIQYIYSLNHTQVINQTFSSNFKRVNNWFYENFMILNPGNAILSPLARTLMTKLWSNHR